MSYRLIREIERKARKPHVCTWCGQRIEVSERYIYERSVWEEEMQSLHWHPECKDDMHAAMGTDGVIEWSPGDHERPKQPAETSEASQRRS